MNARIVATMLSTGVIAATAVGADDVPKPFNFSRYQGMLDHSPFAVATAAAPPSTTASFAKDLYIANAATSADGDLVTIASTADKNFKKYLTTKAPVDGFSISNIEWSEKVGATKVTIAKDGQFATLTFNQALLSQPLASGQPQPGQPNQPQIPQPQTVGQPQVQPAPAVPGAIKPAPIPQLPTPPPRVRGVIPRKPTAGVPAQTPAEREAEL